MLILGAGAIGLLCASVARVSGSSCITIVDIEQSRLDFATGKTGSGKPVAETSVLIPMKAEEGELKSEFASHIAKDIMKQSPSEDPFDVVFECSGVESCVNIGIHSAMPRGKVVLMGMGSPLQSIHIGAAAVREVDLLGLWRYAHTFKTVIELVGSGSVDLKSMISWNAQGMR